MVGKSLLTLIPPDRIEAAHKVISNVRHGQGSGAIETIRLRKDDTPLHVELTVSPFAIQKGR